MKKVVPALLLARVTAGCGLCFTGLLSAHAATIGGSVACLAGNGLRSPANLASVTVFRADIGRSNPSMVMPDGSFFLYNIPPGAYVLEIWSKINPGLPPRIFQVLIQEPVTKLPEINMPC